MTTTRTAKQVEGLIKASLAIRAKAMVNINLHLKAASDLRGIYASEQTRIDELLDELSVICPDSPAVLTPSESVIPE